MRETRRLCVDWIEGGWAELREPKVKKGHWALALIPCAPSWKVCVRQLNETSGCFSAPLPSGLHHKLKATSSH